MFAQVHLVCCPSSWFSGNWLCNFLFL